MKRPDIFRDLQTLCDKHHFISSSRKRSADTFFSASKNQKSNTTKVRIFNSHYEIQLRVIDRTKKHGRILPQDVLEIVFMYLGAATTLMLVRSEPSNWISLSTYKSLCQKFPLPMIYERKYYVQEAPVEDVFLVKDTVRRKEFLIERGELGYVEPADTWTMEWFYLALKGCTLRNDLQTFEELMKSRAINYDELGTKFCRWMHSKLQVEMQDIPFIAFIDKGLVNKPIQRRRFIRYLQKVPAPPEVQAQYPGGANLSV